MYAEYPQNQNQNRSPVSSRYGSNLTLTRQTSRHFEPYNTQTLQAGLMYQEESPSSYDPSARFDRMPSNTLQSPTNYPYENQTWNYGGANAGATPMSATGRMKAQPPRRANLPAVSCGFFVLLWWLLLLLVGARLIFSRVGSTPRCIKPRT